MKTTTLKTHPRWAFCLFAILILVGSSDAVAAGAKDSVDTNQVNLGVSFSHAVSFSVPEYYGIEPKLGLFYNVNGPVGLAGPGWSVSGFSTIDRQSVFLGIPNFTAKDRLFLDGEELIPCAAATSSPGCTAGGTHTTKIESYRKITRSGNDFTVCKDGICNRYAPIICATGGIYRWGIVATTDLLGHSVTYAWTTNNTCTGTPAVGTPAYAYPLSVTYNAARFLVKLNFESSINNFPQATGNGDIVLSKRLKSVDVLVKGLRRAAYAMTYTAGTDVLAKVQPYGTDAIVDASGTVTSGSLLAAAHTFVTPAPTVSFAAGVAAGTIVCPQTQSLTPVDLNGDGYTDFVCIDGRENAADLTNQISVYLNNKAGGFSAATTVPYPNAKKPPTLVDINCDRRPDLVWVATSCPTQWKARLNNGAGVFSSTETSLANMPTDVDNFSSTQFSDINADGCTDVIYPSTTGLPSTRAYKVMFGQRNTSDDPNSVCMSGETAFMNLPSDAAKDGFGVPLPVKYTDINSNGATDIVYFKNTTNTTSAEVRAVLGRGYAMSSTNVLLGMMSEFSNLSAMNFGQLVGGRGSDMLYVKADTLSIMLRPWVNNAQNFGAAVQVATAPSGQPVLWLSTGDFNGDGKQDIVAMTAATTTVMKPYIYLNQGAEPRLAEVRNGVGAVRKIVYANAATQPNTFDVPPQMVVKTISDSANGTAFFTTTYDYSKGLYDFVDKRFIGFWRVSRLQPCVGTVCPKTNVYFDLDYTGAAPTRIDRLDSTGNKLFRSTVLRYGNKNTLPYRKQLVETWDYQYSSASTANRRSASSYTYDAYGRLATTTDYGEGTTGLRLTVNEYTAMGANYASWISRTALYEGPTVLDSMKRSETKYTYEPTKGLLQKSEVWVSPLPAGATTPYVATTYTYDALNRLLQTTQPMNRVTQFTYDPALEMQVATTTNSKGHVERTSWNVSCGKPASTTDANGYVWTYTYDFLCRETSRRHVHGRFVNTSYFLPTASLPQRVRVERAQPGGQLNGNPNIWSESYLDGNQREVETRQSGPSTIIQRTTYDAHGNVSTESNPFYQDQPVHLTSYKYDALGRKLETLFATGDKIVTSYSERNFCTVDEMGNRSCEAVNGLGFRAVRVELSSDGRSLQTQFTNNVKGEVIQIKDPLGNLTTATYDSVGRKVMEEDPVSGTTRTVYNQAGEVERQTNQLGEVTVYTYDPLGRVATQVTRSGTSNAKTTTYTYDVDPILPGSQLGRLTKVVDPLGTTQFSYNAYGEVFRRTRSILAEGDTPPGLQATFYEYDLDGRVIRVSPEDGSASVIYYDEGGRTNNVQMTSNAGASIPVWKQLAYISNNAAGQVDFIWYGNGIFTDYQYQPQRGFLDSITLKDNAGNVKLSYVYTRNKKGLITQLSQNTGGSIVNTTYGYDTRDQLISAVSVPGSAQTWTYDDIGRMLTTPLGTYCYAAGTTKTPAPHAVRSVGDCTLQRYSYNTAGALLAGPLVPNDPLKGTRSLTYNGDGRIEQVTLAQPGVTQAYVESYRYAYDGTRLRSRISTGGITSSNTYFYADGFEITRRSSGETITQTYSLGGIPVARRTRTGTTDTFSFLHLNHLGSVVAESNDSQALSSQIQYAPFGKELNQTFGATAKRHRGYLAEYQDATGLLFLNARYYDAALGQFVSPDAVRSVKTSLGLNPYAYSLNDPINRTDPSGMLSQEAGDAEGQGGTAESITPGDSFVWALGKVFDKVGQVLEAVDQRFSYNIADPGSENGVIHISLFDAFARGGLTIGKEASKKVLILGRDERMEIARMEVQEADPTAIVIHHLTPGKLFPGGTTRGGMAMYEHGFLSIDDLGLSASAGSWGLVFPKLVKGSDQIVFDLRGMSYNPIKHASDYFRGVRIYGFGQGSVVERGTFTDSELAFFYSAEGNRQLNKVFFRNIPANFPVPMITPAKFHTPK